MNILFNSDSYTVLEYPELSSYEVMDKRLRRGAYYSGGVAERFRAGMLDAAGPESDADIEDFLSAFGALEFPLTLH